MAIKTRGKNLPNSVVARYSGHQRNLKCSICNRSFYYDKNLAKHMKVHTSVSAKSCDAKTLESSARNFSSLTGDGILSEVPKLTRPTKDGALLPVVVKNADGTADESEAINKNKMSYKEDQLSSSQFKNSVSGNENQCQKGQFLNDSSSETNVKTLLEISEGQLVHMVNVKGSSASTMVPTEENLKADTSVNLEIPSTSLEPSPLLCDFCGRSFSNPGNFMQHRIMHTGEKPFKCYYCSSSFFEHALWKKHLASHSKQQGYIKTLPDALYPSSLATSMHTTDTETVVMKVNLDLNGKAITNDDTVTATEMTTVRPGRLEQLIKALTKEVAQSSVDITDEKNQSGQTNTIPVKNAIKNLVILQAKSLSTRGTNCKKETSAKTPPSSMQHQCHFCPRSFPRARHLTNHEKIHMRGKQYLFHKSSPANGDVSRESTCDDAKPVLLSGEKSVMESFMRTTDNVVEVITSNKRQILTEVFDQLHPEVTLLQTEQQWTCDFCNKQCINESHLRQHKKIHVEPGGGQCSTLIVHQSQRSCTELSDQQETTDDDPAMIPTVFQNTQENTKGTFVADDNANYIRRNRLNCVSSTNRVHGLPTDILCTTLDKNDSPQTLKFLNKSEILTAGNDLKKSIDKSRRMRHSRKYDKSWFYVSKLKLTKAVQSSPKFPFFCKICGKKFSNKPFFLRHRQQHPTSKLNMFKPTRQCKYSLRWNEWLAAHPRHIYKCSHCDKTLKSYGRFCIHKRFHRREFFVCRQCNVKFCLKNSLKYHSLKCGKDSSHRLLDYSSVAFSNPSDQDVIGSLIEKVEFVPIEKLGQTTESEAPSIKWQCHMCEDCFDQASQLFQHYQTNHSEFLGPFSCPFCKQSCRNAEEVLRHLFSHSNADGNTKVDQISNITNSQITTENLSSSLNSNIVFDVSEKSLQSSGDFKILPLLESAKNLLLTSSSDDYASVAVKDQSTSSDGVLFPQVSNEGPRLQALQNVGKLCEREFCSKNIDHADKLQGYPHPHTKESSYKCTHCDKSFSRIDVYKRHAQQMHHLSYQCKVCSRCYESSSDLAQHQNESNHRPNAECDLPLAKRPSSPYTYKCSVCQKVVRNLKIHMRIHDPNPDTVYRCDVCPKTFLQSGNLKQHLMMHSGERPLHCEFCDKGFIHSSHLKRHRLTHTGERPHKCEYCPRSFAERAKLRMHLRTHTKEKPYTCNYKDCGKSFSLKSLLDVHQLLHTGQRPHSCEDCNRSFTQRCNLIAHRRIHTGERPFKCKICQYTFRNSSNLKDHERLHSNDRPFKCHLCSKLFKRSDYLGKHLLIHSNKRTVRNRGKSKSSNQHAEGQSETLTVNGESPKESYLPSGNTAKLTCNSSHPEVKKNAELHSSYADTLKENIGFDQLIKTFSQEVAEAPVDHMSVPILDDHSNCGTVENVIEIYTEQDSVIVQMSEDNPMVIPQIASSDQASDQDSLERYNIQCHLCSKSFDHTQMLENHIKLHIQEKGDKQKDIAQHTHTEKTPQKSAVLLENQKEVELHTKKALSDCHVGTAEQLTCSPVSEEKSEISHEILTHLSELMYYLADYLKGDLEFQLIGNGQSLYLNSIRQTLKAVEGDNLDLDAKLNATIVTIIEFQTQPEQQYLPSVESGSYGCHLCLFHSLTITTFAEHICKHLSELGWTSAESLVIETDSPLANAKKLSEVKNAMDRNGIPPSKNATDCNVNPLLDQHFSPASQLGTDDSKQNVVTLMTTDDDDRISSDTNNVVITSPRQEIHHVENGNNRHSKTESAPSSSEDSLKDFVEKPNLKATEQTDQLADLMTHLLQEPDDNTHGSKEKFPTATKTEKSLSVEQKNKCQIDMTRQSNRNGNIKKTPSLSSAQSVDPSNTFEIRLECKPGEKPFKCGVCNKTFKKLKYVKDHLKLHVGKTSLACEKCGKVFQRAYNLKKHYKIHQATPSDNNDDQTATGNLNATTTNDSQNKTNGLNNEPKKSHDILDDGKAPEMFSCDICLKTFQLQVYLKQHLKTHSSDKPYACDHCEMVFSQRAYLVKHRRVHTGERPYKCGYCAKSFSRSELLTRHTRTHTKERPYSCPHCSQAFALYNTLKRHLRTHTGLKPFECSVCNQAFTQRGNLSIHMRLHTGERPFKCDRCQNRFIHSSNLKKHLKSCKQDT